MNLRRRLLIGVVAGGVGLSLASAAFACTRYFGDMTFTTVDSVQGTTAQTMTGSGSTTDGGMTWCGGNPASWTMNTSKDASASPNIVLKIKAVPATSCNASGTNQLSAGTYTVGIAHGFMGNAALPTHINCHFSPGTSVPATGGLFVVGTGGVAVEQTFTYASNTAIGYDNICVYMHDVQGPDANDVNVNVV